MRKMTKEEMRELMLVTMHEYIRTEVDDETAYMSWINIVPDEPTQEDFQSIAKDEEEWIECVCLFGHLIERYK